MSEENKITVLIVEPFKPPRVAEISETLSGMQEVVGGYIEEIMPFDDEVALVCNEEGKLHGLQANRALYNDNGKIADVIAGTFFICSAPFESENFESLTPEQQEKYTERFRDPELIRMLGNTIEAFAIPVKNKEHER